MDDRRICLGMSVFGSADWPRQLQGTVISPGPSGSSASMCLASTRSRHMKIHLL